MAWKPLNRKNAAPKARLSRFIPSFQVMESRCLMAADMSMTDGMSDASAMMDDMHNGHHIMVMDDSIVTPHDVIPRFAADPDVVAIRDGDWSNPNTWSTHQVPRLDAIVSIPKTIDVIYDVANPTPIDSLEIGGSLSFDTHEHSSLWVTNLMVLPTGELTIGTEGDRVAASAEIVVRDTELDPTDYSEFGTGVIIFGAFTAHGAEKTTAVRLTSGLETGASTGSIDQVPSNWDINDRLLIPETVQSLTQKNVPVVQDSEVVALTAIDGQEISFAPLTFAHPGTPLNPFGVERYAHVANLTRNIVIRSENPEGTRGHMLAAGNASVEVDSVDFQSLGRTSADEPIDQTVIENGEVVHFGDNAVGRYSFHFHHVTGEISFTNSVVEENLRWGVVIHDTDDGYFAGNIVYDTDGAGFMLEDGSETGNLLENNLVIKVDGGHQTDDKRAGVSWHRDWRDERFLETGTDGSGFWGRSSSNLFVGNTVYDAVGYGYNFNGYYRNEDRPTEGFHHQIELFQNNEVVASKGGLWLTWSQGQGRIDQYERQTFESLLAWNVQEGVTAYHDAKVDMVDFTIVFDPASSSVSESSKTNAFVRTTEGFDFGQPFYENFEHRVIGAKVSGANVGFIGPTNAGASAVLRDSIFANQVNVAFRDVADRHILTFTDVEFVDSLVSPLPDSALPDVVANVWQEGVGVLEQGDLDEAAADLAPPAMPSNLRIFDDRLKIDGSSGDDQIIIDWSEDRESIVVTQRGVEISVPANLINWIHVVGYGGNDHIENRTSLLMVAYGGDGDDTLIGGSGEDRLHGNEGNDRLFGGGGDDILNGGEGDDFLNGQAGIDRLRGRLGNDVLISDSLDLVSEED
ncbi:hypothetical protein C2E31_17575 [Rhodopirellula baltica]|nr:hypothetical protein C2E31_17575 [Rhodopirellula baltica]